MSESASPSMATLRQTLFDTLEGLKSGKLDANRANAVAKVAQTLINSVEVQIKFEQMKLDSKVPRVLPQMDLAAPPLKAIVKVIASEVIE